MNEQMNEEQFIASELEVQIRKEDTVTLIPVSLLLSIIKDDNYYLAFTTNFDESRHLFRAKKQALYAKAMKELIDAINKNNYDFQLTQTHQERIKYIIDNYLKEGKNYLKDIAEYNVNYKFVLSSQKKIGLKNLYDILSENDCLNRFFNAIDRGENFSSHYTNKEILEGFSQMLEQLVKQFDVLKIDDDDPDLYKLISLVHAYSSILEEEDRLYIDKDDFKVMQKCLNPEYLALILSSRTVPLEIKKQYIENINPEKIENLSRYMELGELSKLSQEIENLPSYQEIKRRIDLAMDYVSNDLAFVLKKVFNGFVPDYRYQGLSKIFFFYTYSGYSSRYRNIKDSMGVSTGAQIYINLDSVYEYENPDAALIDAITHEVIHHINYSNKKCTGFKVNDQYFGINEAVTQYLAEQALGDHAYVKITGKHYCYYHKSVLLIEKLVNMGVFSLSELVLNYVQGNVEYLQKALTEYIDLDTYNQVIANFNILNVYENAEGRDKAFQELDTIFIEIREKIKTKEGKRKRS